MHRPIRFSIALIALLTFWPVVAQAAGPHRLAASILYVDSRATGAESGASWEDAFTTLEAALAAAANGDEIWVAAGVYTPPTRFDSFELVNGVAIFGGFAGTEASREQRNWTRNITVISGDVDGDDRNEDGNFISEEVDHIQGDNAGPVLRATNNTLPIHLDGVTVTGGVNAAGSGLLVDNSANFSLAHVTFQGNQGTGANGGAMHNANSSVFLRHVRFLNNSAARGGGLYNGTDGTVVLVDTLFQGNRVANQGGGFANSNSTATLINVAFLGNHADGEGGGMNNGESNATLTNVLFVGNSTGSTVGGGMAAVVGGTVSIVNSTFVENRSAGNGGGLYTFDSTPAVRNSIFWNNGGAERDNQINGALQSVEHSLIQGDDNTENGNLDGATSPGFMHLPNDGGDGWGVGDNDDFGDLRLRDDSALVDRGNNSALPADAYDVDGDGDRSEATPTDLGMQPRIYAAVVDMGAYEYGLTELIFLPTILN